MVTTVWGDYGRWLPEWIASVAAQALRPELVTILDAGADDLGEAREALSDSGLTWQVVTAPYEGMGAARNAAVAATPAEWVMHLDADDTLLPWALADAALLADGADVISMGAVCGGRDVLFPGVSRRAVLRGRLAAFSPSPYRWSLWQRRPYITCNDWVDSALWVGFAHLGARFVATVRPGFVYRDHPGSDSALMSRADKAAAVRQLRRLCRRWEP